MRDVKTKSQVSFLSIQENTSCILLQNENCWISSDAMTPNVNGTNGLNNRSTEQAKAMGTFY